MCHDQFGLSKHNFVPIEILNSVKYCKSEQELKDQILKHIVTVDETSHGIRENKRLKKFLNLLAKWVPMFVKKTYDSVPESRVI